jgi:hypothetical protein
VVVWLLAAALIALPAQAWVESTIASDVATVDAERDGSAVVSHELVLRVRGGPFTGLVLDGVDLDAEPLGDGFVQLARAEVREAPVPLLLQKNEDGSLRIEIDHPKGLRSGSYLLKFRYRTKLLERDLLQNSAQGVELRWVGPRFPDGIDSAKVVFRIPPAKLPPRLASHDGSAASAMAEDVGGVFLSTLRRTADKDELEVIRPHVAKGEPVLWRVWASARAFDAFQPAAASAPIPERREKAPLNRVLALLGIGIAAAGYGWLVFVKSRAHAEACSRRGATPRPLVGIGVGWRSVLAGIGVAGAALAILAAEKPTVAATVLAGVCALATFRTPQVRLRLRGPGSWLPLSEQDAFGPRALLVVPGRWLDVSTARGRLTALGCFTGFAAAAFAIGRASMYFGCALALASVCWVPLFFSGRWSELPDDAVDRAAQVLRRIYAALKTRSSVRVVPWARIADGSRDADELRLLVVPRRPIAGLTALEIAVELQHGPGGTVASPCVLVRALDGSEASRALPPQVGWMRGRKAEERAAVLRPDLPTDRSAIELVMALAAALTRGERPAHSGQSPSSRPSVSGRGQLTSKPATVALPIQLNRLA